MSSLVTGGRILDWILAGMFVEGVVLTLLFARTRRGVRPAALLPNLASGMCLLLAMRLALSGAWWGFPAAALFAALLFHLTDLSRLWS